VTGHRAPPPALALERVHVTRDGRDILDGITWRVEPHERWVVLGPNGSGKTTLLRLCSLWLHPSSGEVHVLGGRLGRVDVRRHRAGIGVASAALAADLRPTLRAVDVVVTARHGALEPWWHAYDAHDRERARALLARMGVGDRAHQPFGTLSSGERQRVLLARTLMTDPGLLLLDEPTAGLDLGGREELLDALAGLAAEPATPATVLVTHHLEEIPPGFSHALLLRDGRSTNAGPLADVLTDDALSETFGLPLAVSHDEATGRWSARHRAQR
jgi:iron complex transport system ATP-binding protein